jgi:hypothetical protein
MSVHRASIRLRATLALTALTLFTNSVSGQSTTSKPGNSDKETVAAQGSRLTNQENKVTGEAPKAGDLKSQVEAVKAENAAFRESLRKMEEQQKLLLEMVERLQRGIDRVTANSSRADQPASTSPAVDTTIPSTTTDAATPSKETEDASGSILPTPIAQTTPEEDRYRDGVVIWETPEDARVPFLLKFNVNTQVRYLNTLSSKDTFTDHLGVVREVNKRNDITVNRAMFILGGYMFNKKLRYSFTVWTSAGSASIVVAGNIGYQFNKALTITGGYTGVPGSRSLVNTFPFFASTDRTMADNFFRPAFTQGIWANGEPVKGLHYLAFVGNGLNTPRSIRICCFPAASGGNRWETTAPPVKHEICTMTISPPKKFACESGPLIQGRGRTAFQISISQVPRTHQCTTQMACLPSRLERLRRG